EDRRNAYAVAGSQAIVDRAARAVHAQLPAADPAVQVALRHAAKAPREKRVQTLPGVVVVDVQMLDRLLETGRRSCRRPPGRRLDRCARREAVRLHAPAAACRAGGRGAVCARSMHVAIYFRGRVRWWPVEWAARSSAVPDSGDDPVDCAESKCPHSPGPSCRESGLYPGDWRRGLLVTRSPPRLESINRGLRTPRGEQARVDAELSREECEQDGCLPSAPPPSAPIPDPRCHRTPSTSLTGR